MHQQQHHQQPRREQHDIHLHRHCEAGGETSCPTQPCLNCTYSAVLDTLPVDHTANIPPVQHKERRGHIEQEHGHRVIEEPKDEYGVDPVGHATEENKQVRGIPMALYVCVCVGCGGRSTCQAV